ncbi:FIG00771561: hypothetical protein [hydrothermal vent metagenome]|uniref:DUF4291 domain-containing protein n=1 Tax=hydrothermal vent metagenome TaxID=652676 RepID=A0A3B0YFI4_9ZZZZ
MDLLLENYQVQQQQWPDHGQHILAQYSQDIVVVYQAYRPEIGLYAEQNQGFGGAFSYSRMSWIKPNFLWMMYRSGWAEKEGQEVVLAIHLKREYFDSILSSAWPSNNSLGVSDKEWKTGLTQSEVRLQWDPDHNPDGRRVGRRAIQLGLRESMLTPFKGEGIIKIENISGFVQEQKKLLDKGLLNQLRTPCERVYPVNDKLRKVLCMQEG